MKKLKILPLLAALLMLLSACSDKGITGEPLTDVTECPSETPGEEPKAEATFRRSTLYYLSDEGYIVPVTKLIPWEEGIAKACLSYLKSDPSNDSYANALGLRTVIPEGAELTLAIEDGNATVNITGLTPLADSKAELDMLKAIVNTLTEFPTISTVTVTRDGAGGTLENGTELPVRHGPYPLNPEKTELETMAGAASATLYFPNLSGAVTVPVTRYMSKTPTLYTLVSALISGSEARGLRSCFPDNTLLLGAAMENGTVTVNLSDDFKAVADVEGLYGLAYKTLWLTLSESFDFERLVIQVNGIRYEPEQVEPPTGVN